MVGCTARAQNDNVVGEASICIRRLHFSFFMNKTNAPNLHVMCNVKATIFCRRRIILESCVSICERLHKHVRFVITLPICVKCESLFLNFVKVISYSHFS